MNTNAETHDNDGAREGTYFWFVCHKGTRLMLRHTDIGVPDEQREVVYVAVERCEIRNYEYSIFPRDESEPVVLRFDDDLDREQSLAAMARPAFPPMRLMVQ